LSQNGYGLAVWTSQEIDYNKVISEDEGSKVFAESRMAPSLSKSISETSIFGSVSFGIVRISFAVKGS
jgi:hypothetical protein